MEEKEKAIQENQMWHNLPWLDWVTQRWFGFVSTLGALVLSVLAGSIFLLLYGHSPLEAYGGLIAGSFGTRYAIAETFLKATPLIFTGLSVAAAAKAGLFNIGAEGQLLAGALGSAVVGTLDFGFSNGIHIFISLIAGGLAGFLWGALPGWIKSRFGAHEVITTIMLNYVALLLTGYMVNYPWKAEGMVAQTERILPTAELPRLLRGSQLSIGIFIGVLAVVLGWFLVKRTVLGYEMRAVGFNPGAAETGGIHTKIVTIITLALAGAFAGVGGGVEVLGVHRRFIQGFSPGFGYDGIAVSVLANDQPWMIPLTAILFGALRAGGAHLDRTTGLPGDFAILMQGLVIFFAASPRIFSYFAKRRQVK